ncbi:hypothetical protein QE152_g4600 [Popillia japonica]|uniref:Uncharacterized protein n=1 Tax=Popillia japonica TaxID=7064 RepID=A0AAW1N0U9_POPJA
MRQQIIRHFNLMGSVTEQNRYLCGLISVFPIQHRRPRNVEAEANLREVSYSYRLIKGNFSLIPISTAHLLQIQKFETATTLAHVKCEEDGVLIGLNPEEYSILFPRGIFVENCSFAYSIYYLRRQRGGVEGREGRKARVLEDKDVDFVTLRLVFNSKEKLIHKVLNGFFAKEVTYLQFCLIWFSIFGIFWLIEKVLYLSPIAYEGGEEKTEEAEKEIEDLLSFAIGQDKKSTADKFSD